MNSVHCMHFDALSSGDDMLRMVLVELQMDPDFRDCMSAHYTHTSYVHIKLCFSFALSLSLYTCVHTHTHTHTHTHNTHNTAQPIAVLCVCVSCIQLFAPLANYNVVSFVDLLCSPSIIAFVCTYLWCIVLQESRTPLMAAAQKNRTAAIQILEANCGRDAATEVVCVSLCTQQTSFMYHRHFVQLYLLSTG